MSVERWTGMERRGTRRAGKSVGSAFSAACGVGDDAAEGGCALEEGQEVGDEAEAGVECQGTQQVDMLGRFYSCLSICCFVLL